MNNETSTAARKGSRATGIIGLIIVLLLGVSAWRGWSVWQARHARETAQVVDAEQRVSALEARLDAVRQDQRAQTQRIQDAASTNRVLRDEVLGLSQRGALLEESVAKLSDPNRHGAQALRLDEVELLLSMAAQRITIARDVRGARHAYALAAGTLDGIDDFRLLNLKQALAQERAAIDAVGNGPQAALIQQLDAFTTNLHKLPLELADNQTDVRPTWQRLLAPLVDVRKARDNALVLPSARNNGEAALQIEISLARAALERGDVEGFHAALKRVQAWLPRLWPQSVALAQARKQLDGMLATPLQFSPPELGSTLLQLRTMRKEGFSVAAARLPAPTDNGNAGEVQP